MPLEQLGNALAFYFFYTESKVGKAALTVVADVYENGVLLLADQASTEIGGGLYRYTLAAGSVDAEGEYIAVGKTATTTVDQRHIPALWVIQKAGIEKLDLLGSGTVNVSAPVSADGVTVTTKQGHAYNAADNLAINWNVTGYPSFVGGTVSVRIQTPSATTTLVGSVVDADTIRLELTSVQSAAIEAGSWPFDVDVTLASARVVTPVQGDWISEAQV